MGSVRMNQVIAGEVDFLTRPVLHEVERICQKRQIELTFLPRMRRGKRAEIRCTAAAVISQSGREWPGVRARRRFFRVKRWIDVVGSLALLVLFLPSC